MLARTPTMQIPSNIVAIFSLMDVILAFKARNIHRPKKDLGLSNVPGLPLLFLIPEKLYGRQREIERPTRCFRPSRVPGYARDVLVSGYSGVGQIVGGERTHKVLACSQQPLYAFDSGYVRSKADGPRKLSELGIGGESGGAKTTTVNLYSILGSPTIYKLVQKAVGAEKPRQYCLSRFAAVEPGNRVIDIGSGPGLAVGYLPQVEYIGFSPASATCSMPAENTQTRPN